MQIKLRDYQQECVDAIVSNGEGRWLSVLATGLGKTCIFSSLPRTGRTLILSHRDELVHQPAKYYDCKVGFEKAGERSDGEDVVSASVQSLSSDARLKRFDVFEFDTIITDEAHHAAAPSYQKVYDYFVTKRHLGFTATPNRGDKVSLGDIYDKIVFERNIRFGIQNGYLCDLRATTVHLNGDLSSIRNSMGDYQVGALSRVVNTPEANAAIGRAYEEYAQGPTLVFATDVEHCEGIAAHIPGARVITGKTPQGERNAILAAFSSGEVPAIVNCMVLTEGTDLPCTSTVIVARPTRNDALYAQMVGRGLRPHPGKEYLRLIDVAGCVEDRNLCAAPTLIGLTPEILYSRLGEREIEGESLIELEREMSEFESSARGWYIMSRESKPNLGDIDRGVCWTVRADGSRFVAAKSFMLQLSCPDALGKAELSYMGGVSEPKQAIFGPASLEECMDVAFHVLIDKAPKEEFLWSREGRKRWADGAASERQINMLRGLIGPEEFGKLMREVGGARLSKDRCSSLIDMAQIMRAEARQSDPRANLATDKQMWYAQKLAYMGRCRPDVAAWLAANWPDVDRRRINVALDMMTEACDWEYPVAQLASDEALASNMASESQIGFLTGLAHSGRLPEQAAESLAQVWPHVDGARASAYITYGRKAAVGSHAPFDPEG